MPSSSLYVRTPPARTTILILHLRIKILQVVAGKILRVSIKVFGLVVHVLRIRLPVQDFQNGLYVLTTMTPTYRRAANAIDFHSHLPTCRQKAHPANDSHLQPLTRSTVARYHRPSFLPVPPTRNQPASPTPPSKPTNQPKQPTTQTALPFLSHRPFSRLIHNFIHLSTTYAYLYVLWITFGSLGYGYASKGSFLYA